MRTPRNEMEAAVQFMSSGNGYVTPPSQQDLVLVHWRAYSENLKRKQAKRSLLQRIGAFLRG